MKVIDIHCHDFIPRSVAVRAMAQMCRMTEGILWPAGDGTLENHLDHMERAGVDCGVWCPIATKVEQFGLLLDRAVALREGGFGARAQRMLVPFASVHPRDSEVRKHLEAIAAAGIRGVKFHSYYQDFSLADRRVWPMFEKIAELGLVVECHAGADVSWREVRGMCGPEEIATLMRHVPGLKLVALHLGGCDGYPPHATDELRELGAWIDTSALHHCWFRDEQMRLLRSWPRERILFGTDFPWVHYPEAISWVKSIRAEADWEALFGENARKLLRL